MGAPAQTMRKHMRIIPTVVRHDPGDPLDPGPVLPDDVADVQQMKGVLEILQRDDLPHDVEVVELVVEDAHLVEVVRKQRETHDALRYFFFPRSRSLCRAIITQQFVALRASFECSLGGRWLVVAACRTPLSSANKAARLAIRTEFARPAAEGSGFIVALLESRLAPSLGHDKARERGYMYNVYNSRCAKRENRLFARVLTAL